MATFTENSLSGQVTDLSKVDLSADTSTSTLTWKDGQKLYLSNEGEAGNITVNILGDGQTSFNCPEYGAIDVSGGFDVVVSIGEVKAVQLTNIKAYLGTSGNTVTVTTTGAAGSSFGWLLSK